MSDSVIEVLAKNAILILMKDSYFSFIHILLIFLSNSESNPLIAAVQTTQ